MILNCEKCLKSETLCVCASISPHSNRLKVVILQHPQEPDKELGSARITHLSLKNSLLKIGLSWPNLKNVLGTKQVDPLRWAVLYLGSGVKDEVKQTNHLNFVSRKGTLEDPPDSLDGVIVLDGTWSQAKTLWWRNAWLLKLRRVILTPQHRSLYKELRKEPRRECLSTIESVAELLEKLGEPAAVSKQLRELFTELLAKKRALNKMPKQKQSTELL